ncbi:MAG: PQQ-binding-like beta-propeller repeat protein, partial [Candidatus Thermoplasmatota archaeon]
MVTKRQVIEKMRDYRRTISYNWQLFRASKIGVIGLIILVFFTAMALSAPFLGLKHPVDWMAPSVDILDVDEYFKSEVSGPINTSIGYRVGETKTLDSRSDRVYAVHGNTIEALKPNGIPIWNSSFDDTALITTAPVCENIGDKVVRDRAEFRVIFGTVDGYVYCLRDNEDADSPAEPRGINLARSAPLDGRISNDPVVYNPDGIVNDRLFITTENGTLYAFSFSSERARLTRVWDVHLSDAPLNAPGVAEVYGAVIVSDTNGSVYAVSKEDGSLIWDYSAGERVSSGIAITPDSKVAYLATDAARLHAINAVNGTPMGSEWEGGMLIMKTLSDVDEGPLNTPAINQDGT